MSKPSAVLANKRYYVFRLIGTLEGFVYIDIQTRWTGFVNGDPKQGEIREASIMNPSWWLKAWKTLKEPFLVVNAAHEVAILLGQGGNALIEEGAAKTMFPERLRPYPYPEKKQTPAYALLPQKPEKVKDRAPTPKVRMKVLERDKYRCKICGRRASEHVDVELNVHHIIPWSEGGLSEAKNLITLCRTCHRGLHPHFQLTLFELLSDEEKPSEEELRFEYRISKKLYQRAWQKEER